MTLVPAQQQQSPMWASRAQPEGSGVFVIMDPPPGLPSLRMGTPRKAAGKPPKFMRLNGLTGKSLRCLAGQPGGVVAVTNESDYLAAETVVTEERNENVAFSSVSTFDVLGALAVDGGVEHTVVLAMRGQQMIVLGKGNNDLGQLGLGRRVQNSTGFKQIRFPHDMWFVKIECGTFFTLMLTQAAEVWAFGHNASGQLGLNRVCQGVYEPELCKTLSGVPVGSLAAGTTHSLALSVTGVLYAAGGNQHGQLGNSTKEDQCVFTEVRALSDVFIVYIAAYGCYSAAIDEYGAMYLWGGKFGCSPQPSALDNNEKFMDVALGADGRVAALTSRHRILVCGYYVNDEQVTVPVEVVSPSLPFVRLYGGGEYFIVLADRNMPLPLSSSFVVSTGRSLLPPTRANSNRMTLRPQQQILAFSVSHFPDFVRMPMAEHILGEIFSSVALLNASFLVDNFNECVSTSSSGMDVLAIVGAYDLFMQAKPLILTVTESFNKLLVRVLTEPLMIGRPGMLRFLMIALLHPSTIEMRDSFDFWRNVVQLMSLMNVYKVFAQWFSVVTAEQLKRVLNALSSFLMMQASETRRLYSPIIIKTVQALEVIYFASTRTHKLELKEFYHDTINEMIDVETEYGMWGSGNGSFCFSRCAPWLLNADTKTRLLRRNSRQMMEEQLQSVAEHAIVFQGPLAVVSPHDLFLIIQVDRNNIMGDTFKAIGELKHPEVELKKPLKVLFKNEPGIDEGGVQREFFQLVLQEMFDSDRGFFTNNEDIYWFNLEARGSTAREAFHRVGSIFGLAIYNGNLLNVRFPLVVYKKLRGLTVTFGDLRDFDIEVMNSLNNILSYTGDVENDMCLSYEYAGVPLCEGGSDILVTNGNKHKYVNDVVQYLLVDSVKEQFDAFHEGFLLAAGTIVLDLFRPEEIALLIAGRGDLDFVALEKATRYEGFTEQSPTVRVFWRIVHNWLTEEEKQRLLYFVTASSRAPINGLASVPFVIARDGEASHIPTSHTCFFMLVLPDDPNEESLLRKIRIALDNAEGFAFK